MSAIENTMSMIEGLFLPEISVFGRRISLSDEPLLDRAAGYKSEDVDAEYQGTPAEAKRALVKYIRDKEGIPVTPESHSRMLSRYGDVIGWRDYGIEYATDRFGVSLTDEEQMTTIAHEYTAGDGHKKTDEEAHSDAVRFLRGFYPRAVPTALSMWSKARNDPNWS